MNNTSSENCLVSAAMGSDGAGGVGFELENMGTESAVGVVGVGGVVGAVEDAVECSLALDAALGAEGTGNVSIFGGTSIPSLAAFSELYTVCFWIALALVRIKVLSASKSGSSVSVS